MMLVYKAIFLFLLQPLTIHSGTSIKCLKPINGHDCGENCLTVQKSNSKNTNSSSQEISYVRVARCSEMFNTVSGVLSHIANSNDNQNSQPSLSGLKLLVQLASLATKAAPNQPARSNQKQWSFKTKSPKVLKAFVINVYNDSDEKKKDDSDKRVSDPWRLDDGNLKSYSDSVKSDGYITRFLKPVDIAVTSFIDQVAASRARNNDDHDFSE